MKKLLLISALALCGVASASAQNFSDIYTVKYKGQKVENGATIVVTPAEVVGDACDYAAEIFVENVREDASQMYGMLLYEDPTFNQATAEPEKYGMLSLCYSGLEYNCLPGGLTNAGQGEVAVPGTASGKTFNWDVHLYGASKDVTSISRLRMSALEGDEAAEEFDLNFALYIKFTAEDTAVDAVEFDENLPIEYYDLAGRRVANPEKGIYILKQGNKTSKKVVC